MNKSKKYSATYFRRMSIGTKVKNKKTGDQRHLIWNFTFSYLKLQQTLLYLRK